MHRYSWRLGPRRLIAIIVIGLFLALSPSAAWGKKFNRKYQYYLDASRAEEILAGLVRPRLYQNEWLDIVKGAKDEQYTIRSGDTLWGISGREFGDPFLWRKLWQVNSYLSNPHEISVGQMLAYYRESDQPPTITVPVVKMSASGLNDLDDDIISNRSIRNRFIPTLMVLSDQEILGEISGSYSHRTSFAETDEIYLDLFNADTVRIGDRFAVVRFDRTLQDQSSPGAPALGSLVRLVGEVAVQSLGEKLVKAEIAKMYNTIRRGDRLIDAQKAINWSAIFNPPEDLTAQVVMGEEPEKVSFSQGDLVLLNKGIDDGMKPGFLFRVFRDTDPVTGSRWDVEPDYKGEVQVVHTGELSSIGVVLNNKEPLSTGDTLIANQLFADPPAPPRRPRQTFEFQ